MQAWTAEGVWTGAGPVRLLMNGRIRHGMQIMNAEFRQVPTTYYGTESGVGVALGGTLRGEDEERGRDRAGRGNHGGVWAGGRPVVAVLRDQSAGGTDCAQSVYVSARLEGAAITVVEGDGRGGVAGANRLRCRGSMCWWWMRSRAMLGFPLHLLTREAMEVVSPAAYVPGGGDRVPCVELVSGSGAGDCAAGGCGRGCRRARGAERSGAGEGRVPRDLGAGD